MERPLLQRRDTQNIWSVTVKNLATFAASYTGIPIESRAKLEKTMKKLLNFEVTREELLDNQLSDCEVDSTTGSATGSSAPSKPRKRKPLGRPIENKPDKGSKKKDAVISAAKKRAMELFECKSSNSQTLPAEETRQESNKIAELQKELQQLKESLHQKSKGFIAIYKL